MLNGFVKPFVNLDKGRQSALLLFDQLQLFGLELQLVHDRFELPILQIYDFSKCL